MTARLGRLTLALLGLLNLAWGLVSLALGGLVPAALIALLAVSRQQ